MLQSARIDIVANDAEISPDGGNWKPIWRHDTELGHDKAASIQEYKTTASNDSTDGSVPLVVFVGDGVSDLPAAREADVLFARRGLRLEEYCIEHRIPYIAFDTFADIQLEIAKIIKEDQEKTQGNGIPVRFNVSLDDISNPTYFANLYYQPRANFWRRASSKNKVATLSSFQNSNILPQSSLGPRMSVSAVSA